MHVVVILHICTTSGAHLRSGKRTCPSIGAYPPILIAHTQDVQHLLRVVNALNVKVRSGAKVLLDSSLHFHQSATTTPLLRHILVLNDHDLYRRDVLSVEVHKLGGRKVRIIAESRSIFVVSTPDEDTDVARSAARKCC